MLQGIAPSYALCKQMYKDSIYLDTQRLPSHKNTLLWLEEELLTLLLGIILSYSEKP